MIEQMQNFGSKPNLSEVNMDCDLNLQAVGKKLIGDVDFSGIMEDFNFKNRSVVGLNKLACNDFFGSFKALPSANLKKIMDVTQSGAAVSTEFISTPSNYVTGSKITAKITGIPDSVTGMIGGANQTKYAGLLLRVVSLDDSIVNISMDGTSSYDVSVHSGDKLYIVTQHWSGNVNGSWTSISSSASKLEVFCDDEIYRSGVIW